MCHNSFRILLIKMKAKERSVFEVFPTISLYKTFHRTVYFPNSTGESPHLHLRISWTQIRAKMRYPCWKLIIYPLKTWQHSVLISRIFAFGPRPLTPLLTSIIVRYLLFSLKNVSISFSKLNVLSFQKTEVFWMKSFLKLIREAPRLSSDIFSV